MISNNFFVTRWGNRPIDDAAMSHHAEVVEYLSQRRFSDGTMRRGYKNTK